MLSQKKMAPEELPIFFLVLRIESKRDKHLFSIFFFFFLFLFFARTKRKECFDFLICWGWAKINNVGIEPFLARVECFDTDELDTKPNPMAEFLSRAHWLFMHRGFAVISPCSFWGTYDSVFQMCIQREVIFFVCGGKNIFFLVDSSFIWSYSIWKNKSFFLFWALHNCFFFHQLNPGTERRPKVVVGWHLWLAVIGVGKKLQFFWVFYGASSQETKKQKGKRLFVANKKMSKELQTKTKAFMNRDTKVFIQRQQLFLVPENLSE